MSFLHIWICLNVYIVKYTSNADGILPQVSANILSDAVRYTNSPHLYIRRWSVGVFH